MSSNERGKRLPVAALVLIVYVLLSLLYFGKKGDYRAMYLGRGYDPIAYIWFLNWWPWALAHGSDPFISHYVWYPEGFNMTWAGSMPIAALLMWPITSLTNAVVSFNLLTLAAPALSAWATFLLARYLTHDTAASFIGGYLYGFSSYELTQMLGHLNLDVTFVVPLFVLLVVQRIRGDLSRSRFIALLAVALLVQLGLATEILATACVFGAITWVIFLAFAAAEERRRLWTVGGEIILAMGIMALVAAPFLYFVLKDRSDVPLHIHPLEAFSADLLNYVIPTRVTWLGGTFFSDMADRFSGSTGEQGAYLGLPLLLILLLQIGEAQRRPYLQALLVSLLVLLISSLGPTLHVAGRITNLWLPWHLTLRLPLINQALPTRFPLYVQLAAALAATLWLSVVKGGRNRAKRFTLAALACLCLLPDRAYLRYWTRLTPEPFFEPQNVAASLGDHANVLMLPYGPSLIWQYQSGMRFTQSAGYVGFVPASEWKWPVVSDLCLGTVGSSFENDLSAFCATHQVSAILVGPGTPDALTAAVNALPWRKTTEHGVRVVRVPDASLLHFHNLSGDCWPVDGSEYWMGHEINIVTHGEPLQVSISGRYRPLNLEPVEIRAVNGSNESRYRIAHPDTQVLKVPADASVTLTASATFVPDQIYHSGDRRSLSVTCIVQRDTGPGQAR